ncbi:MAG: peptide chain release factor N(5)-glutamine methyltransferase [Verrucomicrobia bacterium]|jgi:release factor glutamine methyltransferase|nr:MAG: peptide chain release factor N(5)-glutamine methyltransferase [Verrucomicrobiota bacterium]
MTVLEVLQSTTTYFKKRGIENPRLNAEHLVAYSLGRKRLDVYLEFERDLAEPELLPLRELVRRRAQNEPLQHLLGTVEFCGNVFICDKRALVPRPETEELLELVEPRVVNPRSRILDVGTGSGVIALILAQKFPEAEIIGADISEDALGLARENAVRLGIKHVRFVKSDLLEDLGGKFDVIVANLPYISRHDRDELAPEVLRDPEVALFAGEKGDEIIRRLIEVAPSRLNGRGFLALEIGLGQESALLEFLRGKNYSDIEAKNDYSGNRRFLFARYG